MVEIIYSIIDLIKIFIDKVFNFKIDFINGEYVSIGTIVLAFIFLVTAIYLIFKAFGIKKEDD